MRSSLPVLRLAARLVALEQMAVFCTTPNGNQGGIWMAGQGPVVDSDGNLYVMTGNDSVTVDAKTVGDAPRDGGYRNHSSSLAPAPNSSIGSRRTISPRSTRTTKTSDPQIGRASCRER